MPEEAQTSFIVSDAYR